MQIFVIFLVIFSLSLSAGAVESPFVYSNSTSISTLTDLNPSCREKLLPAYRGHLFIESKYNQSDKTKSNLKSKGDKSSLKVKQDIDTFAKKVALYSDNIIKDQSTIKQATAFACIDEQLKLWANASSLLNVDTSKTGIAVRKWLLASLASSLLKIQTKYSDYIPDKTTVEWLNQLSAAVINDYNPRLQKQSKYFNNHDYWAAWAVAAFAALNNDKDMLAWSASVFSYAMNHASYDKKTGLYYLENETARGVRAVDYANYALTPLLFLADLLHSNNMLNPTDKATLKSLATFTVSANTDVQALAHLIHGKQKKFSKGKYIWVLPYSHIFSKDHVVNTMYQHKLVIGKYSQMGGDLMPFYSRFLQNEDS